MFNLIRQEKTDLFNLMRHPSLGGAIIAKETCVLSRRPATFYEGIWCRASGKSLFAPVINN